jgi:hypothetical protein
MIAWRTPMRRLITSATGAMQLAVHLAQEITCCPAGALIHAVHLAAERSGALQHQVHAELRPGQSGGILAGVAPACPIVLTRISS